VLELAMVVLELAMVVLELAMVVLELAMVVLELAMVGPIGQLGFSRSWMNRALIRTRITVATMTRVDRFFNRLDMTYGLSGSALMLQ